MTFVTKIYHSGILFWILWSVEMFLILPSFTGAVMRLDGASSSAYYIAFFYLLGALLLHTVAKWKGLALVMVGLGTFPLLYLLFIIAVFIIASMAGVPTH